jgi:hypothetical protein
MWLDDPEDTSVGTHRTDAEVRMRPQQRRAALLLDADDRADQPLRRDDRRAQNHAGLAPAVTRTVCASPSSGRCNASRRQSRCEALTETQQCAEPIVLELHVAEFGVPENEAVEASGADVTRDKGTAGALRLDLQGDQWTDKGLADVASHRLARRRRQDESQHGRDGAGGQNHLVHARA